MVSRREAQVTKDFNAAIDEVMGFSAEVFRAAVEETYREIFRLWPVDTAWSIANHRISTSGRSDFVLVPSQRPKEKGALLDQSGQVMFNELLKLQNVKDKDRAKNVIIGNPVPYAADVGDEKDNGFRIYQEAAETGAARVRGMFRRGVLTKPRVKARS